MIPALVAAAGLPVREAMRAALVASAANGALGALIFYRRGNIDWRVAGPLAAGSVAFAVFGAWLNRWLPVPLVVGTLGIVMTAGSVAALRNARGKVPTAIPEHDGRLPLLVAIGGLSGLVAGLTGAGGPSSPFR